MVAFCHQARVVAVGSIHLGHCRDLGGGRGGEEADSRHWGKDCPVTCLKVRRGFETSRLGVVLRRHTSEVSPFEHAPALTRESAFN